MEKKIKRTYVCRDIINHRIKSNIPLNYIPQVADVGIFEVMHIGKHKNIQGFEKRNITIIAGDYIMGAFGTRYATAQFEGYVPDHLNQELHILGAGGTIGVIKSMHYDYKDIGPTKLRFVGLATNDQGEVYNTKKLRAKNIVPFSGAAASATKVILSLGSSMDSGKTTSAAYLAHGLKEAGHKVAYIKLTGTIYTKDCDLVNDLGADITADFGDFGFPSTYMCSQKELFDLYESLLSKILTTQPDYVIMEIADGLYERETKMLLTNKRFISTIEAVIFSAGDSLSAISGIEVLNKWGIYPLAISGLFTASPLLVREVQENIDTPVFTIDELGSADKIHVLFDRTRERVRI